MGFFSNVNKFFSGSPAKVEAVSTLRPEQERLFNQLQRATSGQGAGGAFGDAADYYRDLMSDNPQDLQAFAAPEMRRFKEQIIPGLSEQFAGMGSGGLSSSGFRNATINAGTDLSERLGALRAQLRQQGAAGLQSIGTQGLGNYSQLMQTQESSPGFMSQAAPLFGTAIGSFGGPAGSALGNALGNLFGGKQVGAKTSPYGNAAMAAQIGAGR